MIMNAGTALNALIDRLKAEGVIPLDWEPEDEIGEGDS